MDIHPCPFCGAKAKTDYVRDGRKVVCEGCHASGPAQFHGPAAMPSAEARAIEAWNRRTGSPYHQEPAA
jgi:Lar family restriction alleviation protein